MQTTLEQLEQDLTSIQEQLDLILKQRKIDELVNQANQYADSLLQYRKEVKRAQTNTNKVKVQHKI